MDLYIKPEEGAVYYVINGNRDRSGCILRQMYDREYHFSERYSIFNEKINRKLENNIKTY